LARPDVVWFGETLNQSILEEAEHAARNAKTMLVIGTSALVQPASLLPLIAREAGADVIEFNLEPTPLTPLMDEFHHGPAGKVLPQWYKWNFRNSKS
jgi:NAD-dependent deacetylase